tara:strand:- start:344 stop:538 length:195 start_codon:yes stop_codon:yes gene_type:complete
VVDLEVLLNQVLLDVLVVAVVELEDTLLNKVYLQQQVQVYQLLLEVVAQDMVDKYVLRKVMMQH